MIKKSVAMGPQVQPHDIIRVRAADADLEVCVSYVRATSTGTECSVVLLWDGNPICIGARWASTGWVLSAITPPPSPPPLAPFVETLRQRALSQVPACLITHYLEACGGLPEKRGGLVGIAAARTRLLPHEAQPGRVGSPVMCVAAG